MASNANKYINRVQWPKQAINTNTRTKKGQKKKEELELYYEIQIQKKGKRGKEE